MGASRSGGAAGAPGASVHVTSSLRARSRDSSATRISLFLRLLARVYPATCPRIKGDCNCMSLLCFSGFVGGRFSVTGKIVAVVHRRPPSRPLHAQQPPLTPPLPLPPLPPFPLPCL